MGMIMDGIRKITSRPAPAKAPVPLKPQTPASAEPTAASQSRWPSPEQAAKAWAPTQEQKTPEVREREKNFNAFMSEKTQPLMTIPSRIDENGDELVFNGTADPLRWQVQQDTGKDPGQTDVALTAMSTLVGGSADQALNGGAVFQRGGAMLNDVSSRIGNLGKWGIDDPLDPNDNVRFLYTGKSGKQFRGPGPGKQTKDATGTWVRDPNAEPDNGDVEDYYSLADGTVLSRSDITKAVQSPQMDSRGKLVGYRIDPRRVVSPEYLQDYKKLHRAFPDGTIFSLPDGSIPPDMQNIRTEQANAGITRLGVKDARAPWETHNGDTMFDKSTWDRIAEDDLPVEGGPLNPEAWKNSALNTFNNAKGALGESAVDEALPWFRDLALGSTPYTFMGPSAAMAFAGASSMPALMGYDGNSAKPTGRGLENWLNLGNTEYVKRDLDRSQRIGGGLEGPVGMGMERLSGTAVGGLGNSFPEGSALRKFFSTGAQRWVGSGAVEGMEEGPPVIPQMMSQTPWKDVGRKPLGANDITGEQEYDQNTPRWSTLGANVGAGMGSGIAMGLGFDLLPTIKGDIQAGRDRRQQGAQPAPVIPAAPAVNRKRSQAQLDEELRQTRALERNYGDEEQ